MHLLLRPIFLDPTQDHVGRLTYTPAPHTTQCYTCIDLLHMHQLGSFKAALARSEEAGIDDDVV